MTAVKLIVGLGNPGPEYDQTRHNAGALLVERLADSMHASLQPEKKFFGLTGKFSHKGQDIRLLIPATFMNRSGQAVAALANFFRIQPEEILVVHDELDLPPGTCKIKQGGGHGGHNGLKDIIARLANQNSFYRLRIGIGHPGHSSQVTGHVLSRAPRSEQQLIDSTIEHILTVLPELYDGNLSGATQQLHTYKA